MESSDDEDDDDFVMLSWRFLQPTGILNGLDFFKNADNKLQEELLRTTQLVYSYQDGKGMVPKLREPRNLYALSKELGPQQAARWPADIQVLTDIVRHIRYIPPDPEPFYKASGCERTPMVRGEENGGRLVYMYEPRTSFFVRSRVGGLRSGPQKCNIDLDSEKDTTLIFESRFESGNLAKAIQVNDTDYELWLRYDLYTNKHTQWFYFRVANTRANKTYRFTIVNFMKPDSLYNCGMRPLLYSEKNAQQKKVGWIRGGSDIKYYKNNLRYSSSKSDRSFYSLTWTVEFQHNNDTVYFAHCYPYTYTDLQDYLLDLSNDPVKSKICKQRVLCRTLAGNLVYVLTITSPSQNPEDIKHKKAVVITARVHPGECNASWMMKGFLDYLVGNSADAKLLRDTFIFKIVPMLNPDGVIVGNYRCSLAGRDLNRNYKTVLKDAYPSVWHTKNMIRKLLQEREIIVYCDLHGHSRRQNVFIYGCENRHNPERRLKERVFPLMLNKNAPDLFKYESCKFKVQKSKEGTGRIVMWNMGIMNSYTMEATFCGSTLGKKKGFHFSVSDYEDMGYHFCDTLLDYCDPDNTKSTNILMELEERIKKEIMIRLQKSSTQDINLSDYSSEEIESSDGGSDSSVSDGPPVHLQYAASRPVKKKKKLKTKKERDRVRSLKPEEPKKPTQPERPSSDHVCDKKSTPTMHQQSHTKQEKQASATGMKYTLAVKRPKSNEDRTTSSSLLNEKNEERSRRNDYLEALTNAYLRNGLLVNQEPAAPHFRYSGNKAQSALPFNLEGLCPHHEQTFAAQYMAQQIQNINSGDPDWLRQGIRGQPKVIKPLSQKTQDEILAKLLAMPADPSVDDLVRSQITHQASISPINRSTPQQRHILEVSAAQQRQQDNLLQARQHADKSGNAIRQHPNPFDERNNNSLTPAKSSRPRAQVPSETLYNSENYESKDPRSPEHPEGVVKDQDPLPEDKGKDETREVAEQEEDTTKKHGHKGKHRDHREREGRKSRLAGKEENLAYQSDPEKKVATYVQLKEMSNPLELKLNTKVRQMVIPGERSMPFLSAREMKMSSNHIIRRKSLQEHVSYLRASFPEFQPNLRKKFHDYPRMHESDEEHVTGNEGANYLVDPHKYQGPRVKSAKKGKDMDKAIESIKELRQSLANNAIQQQTLSPTTGGYIKKLMRETDEDIEELTKEIRHDIEYERKLARGRVKKKDTVEPEPSESGDQEPENTDNVPLASDDNTSRHHRHKNQSVYNDADRGSAESAEYQSTESRTNDGSQTSVSKGYHDDDRHYVNKLKSRSMIGYPMSERYSDRSTKWPESTLIVNGDEHSYNYSNNNGGLSRERKISDVVMGPSKKFTDIPLDTSHLSGMIQHRNSYIPSTMTSSTQLSTRTSESSHPPTRFGNVANLAIKSQSAKDYRNGISNI
ncbi:hypothetical protein FSP39_020320 [Pinctada imbricata]|uniref:Peptidase M14 domain-containing protein n=1 Tax=Pinctada imbricata TaxID=66713 RepID=A0AA89C8A3_PINIB|nr:hypothetical protein FSP39_020320 [Pinctada imbricata]